MSAYLGIKTCLTTDCGNITEGRTDFCSSCNRRKRKAVKDRFNEEQKRALPQYTRIPKVGTKNTWQCSSGKRVTQQEINRCRDQAYHLKSLSTDMSVCEGCGRPANCWAHIIAQARAKSIGKTELIWHLGNFFRSCYGCNSAIESPKGIAWNGLKNIGYCLTFIEANDPVLFRKFSDSGTFEL